MTCAAEGEVCGRAACSGKAPDAYAEVEVLWRDVHDYESLHAAPLVNVAWRRELLEDPYMDARCRRLDVEGLSIDVFALDVPIGDGVFLCPGSLSVEQQRELARLTLTRWAAPPNRSNLWPGPVREYADAETCAAKAEGELCDGLAAFVRADGVVVGAPNSGAKVGKVWGASYGEACGITTPGSGRTHYTHPLRARTLGTHSGHHCGHPLGARIGGTHSGCAPRGFRLCNRPAWLGFRPALLVVGPAAEVEHCPVAMSNPIPVPRPNLSLCRSLI